ncbi:MAG: hypothetical protein ACTHJN_19150 [Ginsengibacter sp.]
MKSNFTFGQFNNTAYLKRSTHSSFFSGIPKFVLSAALILLSVNNYAQTFPPATSCTSKDLLLVDARLDVAKCESCSAGNTVTHKLYVSINNKTGSTRTSFAFWANLVVLDADGNVVSTTPISKCFSTIPKNTTTEYYYGQVTYQCGQSLKLTDIWEAWTDASPNSTCPTLLNSTSTINPKCGIVSSLNVRAGDNATIVKTDATCTSKGSLQVSPYGGTGPYKVSLLDNSNNVISGPISVAIGGSTTFSDLAAATYKISITDADNCPAVVLSRTIEATGSVSAPTSGGDQEECAKSPVQTLTASAAAPSGSTLSWWDASSGGNAVSSPTLNSVGTVTYYAQASNGTCTSSRTAVKLTINETPAAPTSGGNQAECAQSPVQTLTATATAPTGSTLSWWDASSGGNSVSNPTLNSVGSVTYYGQSTLGSCSSSRTSVSLQIKSTPAAPKVDVKNNCDGTSDLTASEYTGSLLWSNNETTASIHVTSAGTYTVTQTVDGCTSANGSGTADPKTTPDAPSATMQPVTCSDKTFSVKVNNPVLGTTYSLTQPGNSNDAQTIDYTVAGDVIFTGLTFGDGYRVTATNVAGGCVSSADECGNSNNVTRYMSTSSTIQNQPVVLEKAVTDVKAVPNPYNNIIRFSLQSDVSGQGSLELYNLLGQKVKTVYQGFIQKGFKQNIDYTVPGSLNHSNLIYLFKVGNERKSGILIGAK